MSPTDPLRRKRIHEDSSVSNRKLKKAREERKRKKDLKDDASKKRHKGKRKGKDHHHNHHHCQHKSSDKQETRKKVSKRKHNRSSDSSSSSSSGSGNDSVSGSDGSCSSSSTSTDKNRHHYHRNSSHKSRNKERLKDISEKRPKSHNGTLSDEDHGKSEHTEQPNWIYEAPLKLPRDAIEAHGTMSESSTPPHTSNAEEDGRKLGIPRTAECCIGEKELSLEMSLRQKALANYMKHKDKMDALREKAVPATRFNSEEKTDAVTNNGIFNRNPASAVRVSSNLASNNIINVNIAKEKPSIASNGVPVTRTTIENISVVDGNRKEGEISRDATKMDSGIRGYKNASLQVDEISYKRVQEMDQEGRRDEHEMILSGNVQDNSDMLFRTTVLPSSPKDVLQHPECIDLSNDKGCTLDQVPGKMEDIKELQLSAQEKLVETVSSQKVDNKSMAMEEKQYSHYSSEMHNGDQESSPGFQQKTMSIMRGGDLVQVNYKVYIPKRAVELANRRRLKR